MMAGLIGAAGCAQRSRMRLARTGAVDSHELAWWYATFSDGVRAPIIGIEIPKGGSETDQWILTDRGVRRFRYRSRALIAAGPPIPTTASPGDLEQTRGWLLHYLPAAAPRRALPRERVTQAASAAEFVELLRANWPDVLVDPPARLTPRKIAHEIEAFPHGIAELLAASETMGG